MDTAKSKWITVCTQEDMVPYLGVCALVGNEQVAVFLVDEQFYAISNYDPFSRANVLSRGLVGDLKGELVVASPIYKQHFSLATGACLEDDSIHLAVYPVRMQDGLIQVSSESVAESKAA
ncbi:nitrite reductase small subunit NirD [Parendozoicomonas haliclonae]|uniref:Nitrite reductase (NADH) small subunit n=1 Tax=Parendozoicomonas haliclonae TaxID=1960125 RepID=A0A1X7AG72_9GAMM|nr:nitrite reductase small subunit NirD [Parendozoicomonas haliclonae]SMA37911.1 Nitrite reductase (NADH) small subunit [Parendozoicomonas haliclonae]